MAILNFKVLSDNPKWEKLNASARLLLAAGIAPLSDRNGYGSPRMWSIMKLTGITSRGTYSRAKRELENSGIVVCTKSWEQKEKDGRKIPRSKVHFQIIKSVLWKTDRVYRGKRPVLDTSNSPSSNSRDSGNKGVSIKGVEENNVVISETLKKKNPNKKEEVGLKQTISSLNGKSSEFQMIREYLIRKGIKKNESLLLKWQDDALRNAKSLGIKEPSASWYGLFKNAFGSKRMGIVKATGAACIDAEKFVELNDKEKELYFYKVFNEKLKDYEESTS